MSQTYTTVTQLSHITYNYTSTLMISKPTLPTPNSNHWLTATMITGNRNIQLPTTPPHYNNPPVQHQHTFLMNHSYHSFTHPRIHPLTHSLTHSPTQTHAHAHAHAHEHTHTDNDKSTTLDNHRPHSRLSASLGPMVMQCRLLV